MPERKQFITINWSLLKKVKLRVIDFNIFKILDKYFWLFIALLAGYLIFHESIILFLENNLYFKNINSMSGVYPLKHILLILFFCGLSITYLRYAWIQRRENNYLIITYLLLTIFYFDNRFLRPEFYPFNPVCILETDIMFFDLLLFPILSFLLFYKLPMWLSDTFHIRFEAKEVTEERLQKMTKDTIFIEDNPLKSEETDEKIEKLASLIYSGYYRTSFTVGIVGPWGNGKSSLIRKLEKYSSSSETINIRYSPYLNHRKEDIVTSFFKTLNHELKIYDGKLSALFNNYAQTLLSSFDNGILNKLISLIENEPAHSIYEDINDSIIKINKQIIIYIDDLDRLSPEEILEVFKIIRNTANFRNTVFIVAIDKEYVVNALSNKKQELASTFIDKFFQVEYFLPNVDSTSLIEFIIHELEKKDIYIPNRLKEIKEAFFSTDVLFEYYIINYRDAKKLINQLLLDSKLINTISREVDIKDYINILFLKNKFPKIYLDLIFRREKFLKLNKKGMLSLRKKEKENNNEDLFSFEQEDQLWENSTFLKNYEITESLATKKNEYDVYSTYDLNILKLVLVKLFGDKNIRTHSIKHLRNFYKLTRLEYDPKDLLIDEFLLLIEPEGKFDDEKLLNVLKENKGEQLLLLIEEHICDPEKEEYESILRILLFALSNIDSYKLEAEQVNILLNNKYSEVDLNHFEKDNPWLVQILETDYLMNTKVNMRYRTSFINRCNSKVYFANSIIDLAESDLKRIGIKLFEEYLNGFDDIWKHDDFDCYFHYHKLKEIGIKKDINQMLIKFLAKTKNINTFCSQILEYETMVINSYKISEFAKELYGDYLDFIKSIMNHQHVEKIHKEFLVFLKVMEIVKNSQFVKFIFNKIELRKEGYKISKIEKENMANIVQIFVRVHKDLGKIKFDNLSFNGKQNTFLNNGENYLYFATTQERAEVVFDSYFDIIKNHVQNFESVWLIKNEIKIFVNKARELIEHLVLIEGKLENDKNIKRTLRLDQLDLQGLVMQSESLNVNDYNLDYLDHYVVIQSPELLEKIKELFRKQIIDEQNFTKYIELNKSLIDEIRKLKSITANLEVNIDFQNKIGNIRNSKNELLVELISLQYGERVTKISPTDNYEIF